MTERRRDTRAILKTVVRSERRSPLFRWMVKHHDELIEASRQERFHWTSFCAEAAKRGLTDTQGQAPTAENARKTWARARKAVQEGLELAAAKPPRPKPPSRFPKDWSPTVLREQEIPVPAYLRPAGSEVPPYLRPPSASVPAISPPAVVQPKGPAAEVSVATPEPEIGSPEYVKAQIAVAKKQLADLDWYLNPGVKNRP
jgi:hypothetical protein